jgi:hypothetical protein
MYHKTGISKTYDSTKDYGEVYLAPILDDSYGRLFLLWD